MKQRRLTSLLRNSRLLELLSDTQEISFKALRHSGISGSQELLQSFLLQSLIASPICHVSSVLDDSQGGFWQQLLVIVSVAVINLLVKLNMSLRVCISLQELAKILESLDLLNLFVEARFI